MEKLLSAVTQLVRKMSAWVQIPNIAKERLIIEKWNFEIEYKHKWNKNLTMIIQAMWQMCLCPKMAWTRYNQVC